MNKQQSYVVCRFYEELNDFLSPQFRKKSFRHDFKGRVSVKDLIESLGVPHTEIDLILVNGESVNFNYLIQHEDEISVYPVFEKIDIAGLSKIRAEPLRHIKFVADIHLGKLAKYLRILGFDVLYENDYSDSNLAQISSNEHRILLTRDRGLLKRRIVDYGHFVRHVQPLKQLQEIIDWLDLKRLIKPFYRCIRCNGVLADVDKSEIEDQLLPKTKQYYHQFKQCPDCKHIYWKGSHYLRMKKIIESVINRSYEKNNT